MFDLKKHIILITLFVLQIFYVPAYAQNPLDNKTTFHLYNNNFFHDKEYYNFIADSYTLAGHLIRPEISFKIHENWHLNAGVEAVKYWGINTKIHVNPVFYLDYRYTNHNFRFGTLNRDKSHGIMAPLMDPEFRIRADKVESGMQYQYQTTNLETEVWMDWHRFVRKKDTFREQVNGGIFLRYKIHLNRIVEIQLPVQFTVHHRGGQINLRGRYTEGKNATMTVTSGAMGTALVFKPFTKHHFSVHFNYLFHNINTENTEEFIFPQGKALWGGFDWYTDNWHAGLSYWHAERFNSPLGADIFQTVSRKVERYYEDGQLLRVFSGHTEPLRFLWIAQTGYYHNFSKDFVFKTHLDFYYQPYQVSKPEFPFLKDVYRQLDFLLDVELVYCLQ